MDSVNSALLPVPNKPPHFCGNKATCLLINNVLWLCPQDTDSFHQCPGGKVTRLSSLYLLMRNHSGGENRSGSVVVYLQRWHGWWHMKLLPSQRVLRTPYAPCHFRQNRMRHVHAYLGVTWPATCASGRMTWTFFTCYTGVKRIPKEETLGKKILPPLLQGLEPGTF